MNGYFTNGASGTDLANGTGFAAGGQQEALMRAATLIGMRAIEEQSRLSGVPMMQTAEALASATPRAIMPQAQAQTAQPPATQPQATQPQARRSVAGDLAARVSAELVKLSREGRLKMKPADYAADPEFIANIRRMPVLEAAQLADEKRGDTQTGGNAPQASQTQASQMQASQMQAPQMQTPQPPSSALADAQAQAQAELYEKLRARRALPQSAPVQPVSGEVTDYRDLPDEEFRKLRERMRAAAAEGRHIRF